MSLNSLIDQVSEAVRDWLKQEGLSSQASAFFNTIEASLADSKNQQKDSPSGSTSNENEGPLASKIDHTLLKPDATPEEIQRICSEAREYQFATVCVNSSQIELAARLLKDSKTLPIAVVGFPLGAASTASKAFEAKEAIRKGAREIDMVINIGALKSRNYSFVFDDIYQVVMASKPYPVKVILETASLDQDQKITGCTLAKAAGAAFVKTSTGFGSGGATPEDVALMRRIVGPEMGVKASGGIRTYEDAMKMIAAGASRIGASASVAIVTRAKEAEKKDGTLEENHPQDDSSSDKRSVNKTQNKGLYSSDY